MIPFVDNEITFIEYHYPLIGRLPLYNNVKLLIASYLFSNTCIASTFAKHGYVNCISFICSGCSLRMINKFAIEYASKEGHVKVIQALIK